MPRNALRSGKPAPGTVSGMQLSLVLITAFAFLASATAAAVMPRASGQPTCYSCPLVDLNNWTYQAARSNGLKCVYKKESSYKEAKDGDEDQTK